MLERDWNNMTFEYMIQSFSYVHAVSSRGAQASFLEFVGFLKLDREWLTALTFKWVNRSRQPELYTEYQCALTKTNTIQQSE